MRVYDLIAKKRNGLTLTDQEIENLIRGYTEGTIPDYQFSAFLMAVYFQGMDREETAHLTRSMINSGDTIDLSPIQGIKVDKHSTGGVGDTTTLVLGPIVAAGGIPVAKMSGRGLGHTGGTIDKLEAIPGFSVEFSNKQFIEQVNKLKLAVISQTGNLVPADKKMYSLRDVTATVDSIPLIASSIMSKKLAAGADRILLDVKVGSGAFLEDLTRAEELARRMVDIGNSFGKKTIALLTNMDQPLGEAIGNSLEVIEAIETLKGQGPEDLTELCLVLAGYMFVLGGKVASYQEGYSLAEEIIKTGKGLDKFREMIVCQGGKGEIVDDYKLLTVGRYREVVQSSGSGYIEAIDTQLLGHLAMELGAGREKKEDSIDYGVGLLIKKKIGDLVHPGDALVELVANDQTKLDKISHKVREAFVFSQGRVEPPPLLIKVIE